jgi:hypothetical protein
MPLERLGQYEPLERLAEGSLGPIWLSKDPESGDSVVLRAVESRDRSHPGAWPRLVQALSTLQSLDHPGFARVIGVAESDGTKALVEEHVGGVDFAEWLKAAEGKIDPADLYPIISDVVAALDHARRYEVAHLRINPQSIRILNGDNGRLRAKVVGLGIGRAWGPVLNAEDVTAEDARYLAPEQWHPLLPVGAATDVYSVGVLMYEALTGRVPFKGDTPGEVAKGHLEGPFLPLQDRVPDLPWYLTKTVEAALVRHPADRLSHAGELWLLVEGSRRDAIVEAAPAPRGVRGVISARGAFSDTHPVRKLDYGAYGDTGEIRVDDPPPDPPRGGFRPAKTLPDVDIAMPASELEAERRGEAVTMDDTDHIDPSTLPTEADEARPVGGFTMEDTGHIDPSTLPAAADEARPVGGFAMEDTALHGLGENEPPPTPEFAATEAAAIPPSLQGIDLGPPIGPSDPLPEDQVDPEEDTGQFEFDLTEAQEVPTGLRGINLEATTDQVHIPGKLAKPKSDTPRPRPPSPPPPPAAAAPPPKDFANAKTQGAEIPDFLRRIDLGGDD